MNTKEYWKNIDLNLNELINNGAVKLPSLKLFNLESLAEDISYIFLYPFSFQLSFS